MRQVSPEIMRPLGQQDPISGTREHILRALFPWDYDYVIDAGLDRMFYHDPETGEDGLIHTLAGEISPTTQRPRGFHHNPSATAVWPTIVAKDGSKRVVTRVLEERRREPRYPMEPSTEVVAINSFVKKTKQKDPITGRWRLMEGEYGMFPEEYDALAVVQAIGIAMRTRDQAKDGSGTGPGRPAIIAEGRAPLVDGKSFMDIKLIIDKGTGKIVTAYPIVDQYPIMGLSEREMWRLVTS